MWIKVEQKCFMTNKNKEKNRKNNQNTKKRMGKTHRTKIDQVRWTFHKKVCLFKPLP